MQLFAGKIKSKNNIKSNFGKDLDYLLENRCELIGLFYL